MKKIALFLESTYFIIFVSIFTVICWYLEAPMLAYAIYIVFLILIIISNAKRYVIGMILLTAIINYQGDFGVGSSAFEDYLILFLPVGIIAIIALVVDIIIKRPKFKPTGIFWGFLALLVANILSLVNVENREVLLVSLIGILQLVAFFLVFIYFDLFKGSKDKEEGLVNTKSYLSNVALILSTAISLELIIHYLDIGGAISKSSHDLSWGVSNTIAMFYLVLIPLGLSNYFKNQKKFYIIPLTLVNCALLVLMLSRGAFLAIAVIIIPFAIISYLIVKDKKRFLVDLLTSIVISFIISLIATSSLGLIDTFLGYLEKIDFTNGNGRMPLYEKGFEVFKANPVFGAGSYSAAYYLKEFRLGTYHNHIIQALATTGIVGLLALIYFSYEIIKACLKKNPFNIMFLFSMAAIIIHGIVDNTFYNPIIMIFFAVMLPVLTTTVEKSQISDEITMEEVQISDETLKE